MKADVFILGGGLSGFAAAVGAARCGASVILAERNSALGGTATVSLVGPLQTFHAPGGRVIGGVAQEIIDALKKGGASPGHIPDPIGFANSVTPVDPDVMEVLLEDTLKRENVTVLLGHSLEEVAVSRSAVTSVVLTGQNGETTGIEARCFIDASGNGDLTAMSGNEMEIDENCQPMTLIFVMEGVDNRAVVEYQKRHSDEFYMPKDISVLDRGYAGVSGFFEHVRKAREAGRLSVPRDRLLFFGTTRPGEITVNTTRVTGFNGLDKKEVAEAKRVAEAQAIELAKFMTGEIPGFKNARIVRIAEQIGVRETRRLAGRYIMNERDVIQTAHFDDAISKGAYPMDMHLPDGAGLKSEHVGGKGFYDIPLRSLIGRRIENLVTVGKCISVTHEGFSSTRVMPTCMAVGEAGGVAAAFHASTGKDFEELISDIQNALRRRGAIVFDEDVVTSDRPGGGS